MDRRCKTCSLWSPGVPGECKCELNVLPEWASDLLDSFCAFTGENDGQQCEMWRDELGANVRGDGISRRYVNQRFDAKDFSSLEDLELELMMNYSLDRQQARTIVYSELDKRPVDFLA